MDVSKTPTRRNRVSNDNNTSMYEGSCRRLPMTRWLRIHNNTSQVTNSEHCLPVNDLSYHEARNETRDETKPPSIPHSLYYKWVFEQTIVV